VDFEFGHRMAIPVIQGVVIAVEHHDRVMEEVAKEEAERARKEDEKKRKEVLGMWRKLLMGMRIVERIRVDYGDMTDEQVFGPHHGHNVKPAETVVRDEDLAGGFLPDGFVEEEDEEAHAAAPTTSGFFPVVDNEADVEDGDALMVDHGDVATVATPASTDVQNRDGPGASAKPKPGGYGRATKATAEAQVRAPPKKQATTSRRTNRKKAPTSSDQDEEDSDLSDPPEDSDDDYEA
jgi:xeroderma pigmentosum group C-complementing protein